MSSHFKNSWRQLFPGKKCKVIDMTISINEPKFSRRILNFLRQTAKSLLPDTAINLISIPWRKFYWWRRTRISPSRNRRVIAALVSSGKPINLELGSWRRDGLDDWVFSDLGGGGDVQLDLVKPIPFPDSSVDRIYSSHLLEHFSFPHPMLDLLRECHRILKPGGEFSIAVPNARIFLDAYANPNGFEAKKYCSHDVGLTYKNKIDYVNFIAYLGGEHKHLFDIDNLPSVLTEAGFQNARVRDFDPSLDLEERKHESIYAIAYR